MITHEFIRIALETLGMTVILIAIGSLCGYIMARIGIWLDVD